MLLNEYGQIAYDEWVALVQRFPNFELDVFQIMPNHMHGIIVLNPVGATLAVDLDSTVVAPDNIGIVPDNITVTPNNLGIAGDHTSAPDGADIIGTEASPAATVGDIVVAYKSLVAKGCLDIYKSKNKMMGKLWQRNYYERIIRYQQSYQFVSDYIINNPSKWIDDRFYIKWTAGESERIIQSSTSGNT